MTERSAQITRGAGPGQAVPDRRSAVDDRSDARSRPGKETVWAYTHLPREIRGRRGGEIAMPFDRSGAANGSPIGCRTRIEELAPGFGALVRGRHVMGPADLQRRNAQPGRRRDQRRHRRRCTSSSCSVRRPGLGRPETPIRNLYLASVERASGRRRARRVRLQRGAGRDRPRSAAEGAPESKKPALRRRRECCSNPEGTPRPGGDPWRSRTGAAGSPSRRAGGDASQAQGSVTPVSDAAKPRIENFRISAIRCMARSRG